MGEFKCPYTGKTYPVTEMTDEHIIPHALGGTLAYKIRASKEANTQLGSQLDAALADSFLIQGLRVINGIKARTGEPMWKLRGRDATTGATVDLEVGPVGIVKSRTTPLVTKDETGQKMRVVIDAKNQAKFLEQLTNGLRRTGHEPKLVASHEIQGRQIQIEEVIDLTTLRRALLKIAFSAGYEFIGERFLDDPSVGEWRKVLFAPTNEDARTAQIRGKSFDPSALPQGFMPQLQPHEHGVVVANVGMQGPVVGVSLFGNGFHCLVAMLSTTSDLGLKCAEGRVVIADAKTRSVRVQAFSDVLTSMARNAISQPSDQPCPDQGHSRD